jgi:hypothetical protein
VLFSKARFFEPAVFRSLDSWHAWIALGQKFQAMVALFPDSNSVSTAARACSGKSRTLQSDSHD